MKKLIPIILIAVLAAAWFGYLTFQGQNKLAELRLLAKGEMSKLIIFDKPRDLPKTPFFDRLGNRVTFEDFKGKVLLVNLWATWCEPCREEMPTLDALQAALVGENIQIITLSIDWKGYQVIDEFYEEYKIKHLPAYWDKSNRLPAEFEVIGLPLTVLISSDGKWIGRMDGPAVWSSPDAIALMKKASEE